MSEGDAAPPEPSRARGVLALVFALLIAAGTLAIFWNKGHVPPKMSGTLEHMASIQGRNAEACLSCHRAGGAGPLRPKNHTPRQDCWNCHEIAR